jgi:hypothetical protein
LQIRKLAFALIHSSTILLPRWKATLAELGMKEKIMPRDVSTRWNSTYDMLAFAIDHKVAVNRMTADVENGLRAYEMDVKEWGYALELHAVLKVRAKTERHHLAPPRWPVRRSGDCNLILTSFMF